MADAGDDLPRSVGSHPVRRAPQAAGRPGDLRRTLRSLPGGLRPGPRATTPVSPELALQCRAMRSHHVIAALVLLVGCDSGQQPAEPQPPFLITSTPTA